MPIRAVRASAALALSAAASLGWAVPPRALLTSDAGLPTDFVPGSGGIPISSFTQADVRVSASGTYWSLNVNTSSQPAPDVGWVVIGTPTQALGGFTRTATIADPAIGFPMSTRPDTPYGVNDDGQVAFTVALAGAVPTTTNEILLRYDLATASFTTLAREGSPIPGIPGEGFGGILDSVTLLSDGRASLRDGSTQGSLPSSQDEFYFLVGPNPADTVTALVQSDTFAPTNQAGGTTANIDDVFEGFVSDDGLSSIVEVGLFPPASGTRALVKDGEVVLQALVPIPGVPGLPQNVGEFEMFPGGDWAVHGSTDAGISYLLVNGSLVLKEGDSFPTADPGESIMSILDADISRRGDVAVLVRTTFDGTLLARDLVIVYPADGSPAFVPLTRGKNNVVTAGTRIDLDGDGLGDNAYYFVGNEGSLAIADDGNLYIVTRALNAQFLTEADALIILNVLPPAGCSPADLNADGDLNSSDFLEFLNLFAAQDARADLDEDGVWNSSDFLTYLNLYALGC